jgi:hypothetical protein
MRRAARIAAWAAGVLAAALLASTVGRVPPQEIVLRGPGGEPIEGGWVGYRYKGYSFNLVCSITWHRPGGVVATDAAGRAVIPGHLYWKRPLDGYLRPQVELAYAPALHNAGRYGPETASSPGRAAIDPERRTATLSDLGGDPEGWQRSMYDLHTFLRKAMDGKPGRDDRVEAGPDALCALAAHLRAEHEAFLARHGESPRPGPEEAVAREPLWGPFAERIWRRDLDSLDRELAAECEP